MADRDSQAELGSLNPTTGKDVTADEEKNAACYRFGTTSFIVGMLVSAATLAATVLGIYVFLGNCGSVNSYNFQLSAIVFFAFTGAAVVVAEVTSGCGMPIAGIKHPHAINYQAFRELVWGAFMAASLSLWPIFALRHKTDPGVIEAYDNCLASGIYLIPDGIAYAQYYYNAVVFGTALWVIAMYQTHKWFMGEMYPMRTSKADE